MSQPAVLIERMSKLYRLMSSDDYGYRTLRDSIAGLFRRRDRTASNEARELWALRDIDLQIEKGEAVGIIGHNGAGKSTLLKILTRITEPTSGRAVLHGRVASLLEVGTGFHPELTGRENIYLNGAILGMTRTEIKKKFDEIVAFAGIEKFLDTPVKRYSSGMYVRLAFAVAAHLEPEILLVDEVLAVGDAQFQKKCLGKMGEVAKGGRTVLFVSHQTNQIRRLCQSAVWLDAGKVRFRGRAGETISRYEQSAASDDDNGTQGNCTFVKWDILDHGHVVREGPQPVRFRFVARLQRPVSNGHFGVAILNEADSVIAGWAFERLSLDKGLREFLLEVPSLPIRPGAYSLVCTLFNQGNNLNGGDLLERWIAVPRLLVDAPPLSHPQDAWAGVLNIPASLKVHGVNNGAA
jgi:lipopolysaccharide transport system ATP-binding protein